MLRDSQIDLCGQVDFTRTQPLLGRDEAFSFACNGCGNCRGGLGEIQESWYFLFQTLSACASYQQDFGASLVCPDQDEEVFDFV